LKNSSGDHSYSIALRERHPQFDVFCGSEEFLLETMRIGGVGCISATGNSNPKGISHLYQNVNTPEAESLQESVNSIRATFQSRPMIPALKAVVSQAYQDPQWMQVRPPLVQLPKNEVGALVQELDGHAFSPSQVFA
jgi:4-hydroxy-tetrahydrodipicolinate synthase